MTTLIKYKFTLLQHTVTHYSHTHKEVKWWLELSCQKCSHVRNERLSSEAVLEKNLLWVAWNSCISYLYINHVITIWRGFCQNLCHTQSFPLHNKHIKLVISCWKTWKNPFIQPTWLASVWHRVSGSVAKQSRMNSTMTDVLLEVLVGAPEIHKYFIPVCLFPCPATFLTLKYCKLL